MALVRYLAAIALIASAGPLTVVLGQGASETTDVCLRWAQAATTVGNQLYLYGGNAKTYASQTSGTWNNNLVKVDLSTGWSIAAPPLSALSSNGSATPPAVALGALYPSTDGQSLFQMMGEYSDSPTATPEPFAVYQYSISGNSWSKVNADTSGISGVAEAGYTFDPTKGVAYVFGGHQDYLSTANYNNQIARLYLNSLLQFDTIKSTFYNASTYTPPPRVTNTSNIEDTPVYRADNTLTYVAGIGDGGGDGIVSLGGGSDTAMVGFNIIDVFDINDQVWRRVPTSGDIPSTRVSHCAAIAHGTDPKNNNANSSTIIIYGGQNVRNETTQLSDVYALDIGSWTWTFIGNNLQSQPGGTGTGRSGQSCNVVGAQMVVVGGYPGPDILCDKPGVFVFDVSQLAWVNNFDPTASYVVNDKIQRPTASASASATSAPSPVVTTVTKTISGSVTLSTMTNYAQTADSEVSTSSPSSPSSAGSSGSSSSNIGAIVGGVIGGIVALLLFLLLLVCMRRRRRRGDGSESNEKNGGKVNRWLGDRYGFGRSSNDTEGSSANGAGAAAIYGGSRPHTTNGGANVNSPLINTSSASDDPEELTRNMEAVSVGRFMKPKGELKILNPDEG